LMVFMVLNKVVSCIKEENILRLVLTGQFRGFPSPECEIRDTRSPY
jgi:hypothetical protein